MAERPASEIARETFKQLAARRLPPSPDNYRAVYDEIAGVRSPTGFPDGPLRQISRILPGQTPAQKRLLNQFESAIEQQSWTELQRAIVGYANVGLNPASTTPAAEEAATSRLPGEVLEQVARLVENTLPALAADDARLSEQAAQLITVLRQPDPDAAVLKSLLANLGFRLSFAAEEQTAIRSGLLQALHELFRNIGVLSVDERWLSGQAEALLAASTPPLQLRKLDELQARLRDVIFKQSEAKARTVEAHERMKEMLAAFVERLSAMTQESGVYQDKIEHCAELIVAATTIEQIAPVLQEVIGATRAMALDSRLHRDELLTMRERAEQAQGDVDRLQQALEKASAEARHDPLTGALNRKGMDEALASEISRMGRAQEAPEAPPTLSVALMDIDNFKQINDRLGHDGGDAALVHLARVAREAMRPQDVLARYGGEEFVLLLPATDADAGVAAMQRLQRELTRRFFLQNNEKVLITFSAGVSQVAPGEDPGEAVKRADEAMYLAKRAGKNRVLKA